MIQLTVVKKQLPGVMKLVDRKRWIEIYYSSDNRYCVKLHAVIRNVVEMVVKRFEYMCLGSPEIGFLCTLCDTNDHYCVLSHDHLMISCSRDDSKDGPVSPDMLCWIERSEGQ